jgi:protein phosphatase
VNYLYAAATHRGRLRNNNEDSHWPTSAGRSTGSLVVMVADGMGGAAGGEIASTVAVETASEGDGSLIDRIDRANFRIYERSLADPSLAGMGTTLTMIEFGPDGSARLAHVGDSRAYLWREGDIEQISEDHTVVAEQLAAGRITEADIAHHPQRSMLTRVLGLTPDVEVDEVEFELEAGDRLLVCSDGLTNMVDDDRIAQIMSEGSPEEIAWNLVEAANRAGGHDNITVVVVAVGP